MNALWKAFVALLPVFLLLAGILYLLFAGEHSHQEWPDMPPVVEKQQHSK